MRKFILKNSQRVFYLTGGALLFAIAAFILMQFVSWDEDFLTSQVPGNSAKSGAIDEGKQQDLKEKLSAGTDLFLRRATEKKEEASLERETRKELENFIKSFLRVWEDYPQKNYQERLAPYVLPESLSKISDRRDSIDNPLVNCQVRCLYASSFPAQEIPLRVLAVDREHAEVAFSAFVLYRSLDGKAGDISGLQPRFYTLILLPRGKSWLVARALALYQ